MGAAERRYGSEEAERYQRSRHGPDGKLFIDPLISGFLKDSTDQIILDVGMGAGPVAIEAIRTGASFVYGIDNSPAMIERADSAIWEAGLADRISAKVGDARSLDFPDNSFRRIVSVNVGCNLNDEVLAAHLNEMQRVVTPEGKILFTAPIHLGEVFTNGDTQALWPRLIATVNAINDDLENGEEIDVQRVVQRKLGDIKELHRGTFVMRNGKIKLVANNKDELPEEIQEFTILESELHEGEEIYRKLPGLVVPNNYHSQERYEELIKASGLKIVERYQGIFPTEEDRQRYNREIPEDQQDRMLGLEYLGKGPFAVYVLMKDDNPED